MDRRVIPPKRVTSATWGPPPPCKQALSDYRETTDKRSSVIHNNHDEHHKVYTLAVEFRFLSFNLFNYFSY